MKQTHSPDIIHRDFFSQVPKSLINFNFSLKSGCTYSFTSKNRRPFSINVFDNIAASGWLRYKVSTVPIGSENSANYSPVREATRLPSCIRHLQWKSWLGWTSYFLATCEMLMSGCYASSTIARFCSPVHRLLLCTEVITSIVPISLPSLNYSNTSTRITIT